MRRPFPLLATLIFAAVSIAQGQVDTQPNVLLIIADDMAWTDYGFMGHPLVRTPNLDRLAREGLTYTHGYVPSSLCCPSLASIITGQYPHRHRITGNEVGPRGARTPEKRRRFIAHMEKAPALPRLLRPRGYRSLQTGKWWMSAPATAGFTEGMTHGDPRRGGRHGDEGLRIGREGVDPILDFIDSGKPGVPFFVWYAPFLPHRPHDPPERLLAHYRERVDSNHMARYLAMITWLDETCGELLTGLDERGLARDTLVVFVCDNGWIQREDGQGYAQRSKRSPYEGGVRTPIILRWPGRIAPRTVHTPVSSIDIAPTLLAACGAAIPKTVQGLDLRDGDAVRGRDVIFGDLHLHDAVDVADPRRNVTYRWCIQDGWKLILPNASNMSRAGHGARGPGTVELYHVADDPHERHDLAAEHPNRVRELSALIDAWWPLTDR